MMGLNTNDELCQALFASALQRSDAVTPEAVTQAIADPLRALGLSGCTGRMAQEFGDHPEAASERMRWALQTVAEIPTGPVTPTSPAVFARDSLVDTAA